MWQDIKNIYHLSRAFIASAIYGFPGQKLQIIGVTGTSGKTTTTHMIYKILKDSGENVSLISSVKAIIHDNEIDTGFHVTTPDSYNLQKYLNLAKKAGDKYFILEISSHAIDQYRIAFIKFHVSVLTTLAHEHLDYHKTFLNYARTKFKLINISNFAVIPQDSINNSDNLLKNKKTVTFGITKGLETQAEWNLKLKIPGDYNLRNALAAASVARILNIPDTVIKKSLDSFVGIEGRYQAINNKLGFKIIIDFAHKPDALREVLLTAKKEIKNSGRVIVMFGCASQRDVLKRPIMGKISAELADITVLTDEDPRFEDSMKIINEIAQGCESGKAKEKDLNSATLFKEHVYFKIPDRYMAIKFIVTKLAEKGDIILLCGKGHEKSMNYNGVERPWNEQNAVLKVLENL